MLRVRLVDGDRRLPVQQPVDQIVSPGRRTVAFEVDPQRRDRFALRQIATDANAWNPLQHVLDRVETPLPVLQILLVTAGGKATEGRNESDDFLPSDFHRAPEPLVWHSGEVTRI